ncbi:MAG: dockerin type I repeat-containing protein [Phycisphaerae bacterium]
MTERQSDQIETLLRMALESESLADPSAERAGGAAPPVLGAAPAGSACLRIGRLNAIAAGVAAARAESLHVSDCGICAARLRALRGGATGAAAASVPSRWQRWAFRLGTGAVAAALFLMVTHRAPPARLPGGAVIPPTWNLTAFPANRTQYQCLQGDANCDGVVSASDVPVLVLAMARPDVYSIDFPGCDSLCSNDLNGDGVVDGSDLVELVQCVGTN